MLLVFYTVFEQLALLSFFKACEEFLSFSWVRSSKSRQPIFDLAYQAFKTGVLTLKTFYLDFRGQNRSKTCLKLVSHLARNRQANLSADWALQFRVWRFQMPGLGGVPWGLLHKKSGFGCAQSIGYTFGALFFVWIVFLLVAFAPIRGAFYCFPLVFCVILRRCDATSFCFQSFVAC